MAECKLSKIEANETVAGDPTQDTRTLSWCSASVVMATTALGAGVLNFPAAYHHAGGVLAATLVQVLMVLVLGMTVIVLAYCADVNKDCTYHDVVLSTCGPRCRCMVAVSVLLTCYGVCITYLLVIGDQFDRLFASLYGQDFCHKWYMNRQFTISLTASIFVMPLCFLRQINYLQYVSSLGIVAVLYPCLLTVHVYYTTDVRDVMIKTVPSSYTELLVTVPVFCFAYQTHEVAIPVYAAMRDRTLSALAKVVASSMLVLLVAYCVVGTFGYMTYGSAVQPDIMEMFDATQTWVQFGVVALIIKMVITYPLLAICGRNTLEGLSMDRLPAKIEVESDRRRFFLSFGWFASSVCLAVLPVDIGVAVKLLGSLAALNIFMFPGLCLLGLIQKKIAVVSHPYWLGCLAVVMVVVGGVLSLAVLVQTIMVDLVSGQARQLCS